MGSVDVGEHTICCRVAKIAKMQEMSQVPVLDRATATELKVAKAHQLLNRQGLAIVA